MKKILLLSNNENAKRLFARLKEKGNDVILYSEPLSAEALRTFSPDLVISYNYQHIVDGDIVDMLGNKIINMHTSFLPWNKGSSPNIWSFIDDTPKGVTIHRLEKGLDTGKIIAQRELFFNERDETLASTYEKLNEEIVNLLIENWTEIEAENYVLKDQNGAGTYHRTADLNKLLKGAKLDYSMTIEEFKSFIARCKEH